MSKIRLNYNKTDYTLEYSRQSVKTMEAQGFNLNELTDKPMTMIPMLFEGAFIKNHRGVKRKIMSDIYDEIADKSGLTERLMEMYAETLSTLTETNPDAGNVTWTVEE